MTDKRITPHPRRLQRKRIKGYRLAEGTVCVTRGTKWGNPFRVAGEVDNQEAVKRFRDWLAGTAWSEVEPDRRIWILANLPELYGFDLACYCRPDVPCHADVLAELSDPPFKVDEGDYLFTFYDGSIYQMRHISRHLVDKITPQRVLLLSRDMFLLYPNGLCTPPATRAFDAVEWKPDFAPYKPRWVDRERLEKNGRAYHSTSKSLHFVEEIARGEFSKNVDSYMRAKARKSG